jgi:hypothetical protein
MKNSGFYLLALWLITQSILTLTTLHFPYEKIVLAAVALCAGLSLLLYMLKTKIGEIGLLLLSIWLILRSSQFLLHFTFPYIDTTIAILGITAGFFLIIRK